MNKISKRISIDSKIEEIMKKTTSSKKRIPTYYSKKKDSMYYLILMFLRKSHENNKEFVFSRLYLELAFETLGFWKMKMRGSRMVDFETFYESVLKNKASLMKFGGKKAENMKESKYKVLVTEAVELMKELKIVKQENKTVAFSKMMHFIYPDLFMPIDNKYTLGYFKEIKNLPQDDKFIESMMISYTITKYLKNNNISVKINLNKTTIELPKTKIIDDIIMHINN